MKSLRLMLPVFMMIWLCILGTATAAPIDSSYAVEYWSRQHAPNSGFAPMADWIVPAAGTTYPSGVSSGIAMSLPNVTGSLVSDFETTGDFQFSGYMRATSEAASFGIVFGWQDYLNTYYLKWSSGSTGGTGTMGAGLKVIRIDNGTETVLEEVSDLWTEDAWHRFDVQRNDDILSILVWPAAGAVTLLEAIIDDASYMSGSIGLWGSVSDEPPQWSGLDIEPAPVPEPATMLLLSSGLAGLAAIRRRFTKSNKSIQH